MTRLSHLLLALPIVFLILALVLCAEAQTFQEVLYPLSADLSNIVSPVGSATSSIDLANINIWNVPFDDGFGNVLEVRANSGSTSPAAAISTNTYFTVTFSSSDAMNTLEFDVNSGGSSTPRGWVVRTSLDGYASDLGSGSTVYAAPALVTMSLPSDVSSITFRIYVFSPSISSSVDFRNLRLLYVPPVSPTE